MVNPIKNLFDIYNPKKIKENWNKVKSSPYKVAKSETSPTVPILIPFIVIVFSCNVPYVPF